MTDVWKQIVVSHVKVGYCRNICIKEQRKIIKIQKRIDILTVMAHIRILANRNKCQLHTHDVSFI